MCDSNSNCVLTEAHTYHRDAFGTEWRSESAQAMIQRALHLIDNGCRCCGRLESECICPSFTPSTPAGVAR